MGYITYISYNFNLKITSYLTISIKKWPSLCTHSTLLQKPSP